METANIEYKEDKTKDSYRAHLFCNGEFSGDIKLVPMPSNVGYDLPEEYRKSLHLADINVKPEFRGRGFGSSLLEKALKFAEEKQKKAVLVAHPKGEKKMSQQELIDFYLKRELRELDVKITGCLCHSPKSKS